MASNKFAGRVQQKHDIEANWIKAVNFIPMAGELIVYMAETPEDALPAGRTWRFTTPRFKIGDGITNVNNLPFASMNVYDDNEGNITFII